jgi:hypothetical protein
LNNGAWSEELAEYGGFCDWGKIGTPCIRELRHLRLHDRSVEGALIVFVVFGRGDRYRSTGAFGG